MNDSLKWEQDELQETSALQSLEKEADRLCESALNEAKEQLHPLLRSADVSRLEKRSEFIQAFRSALEKRIAKKLAASQPSIQSVFRYDDSHTANDPSWDGSIHLLVKVPRLSDAIKSFGKYLDKYVSEYLAKQLGWTRFRGQQSILDIRQVTVNELRHGISYGAMFYAVHSAPVKVWPLKKAQ